MVEQQTRRITILGDNTATSGQMGAFLRRINPDAPNYAQLYLTIGEKYGIRGDVAFAQAIHETGAWRFGGDVLPEQNNFAGIGAIGGGARGASFETPAEGIEAQIQHLYGYATRAPLPSGTRLVDPRFGLLEKAGLRGSAQHWQDLNGKWAVPGVGYGENIIRLWEQMLKLPEDADPAPATRDSEEPSGSEEPINDPQAWKREALEWLSAERLINSPHDPDAPVTWAEFGTDLKRVVDRFNRQ